MQYGNKIGNFTTLAGCVARLATLGWTLTKGMSYFNTTENVEYEYDGTDWITVQDGGTVACFELAQTGQPTANDLLKIGVDVYEANGAGGNINVVIAGGANGTMANLLAAIIAHGTEHILADSIDATHIRIRSADAANGNVIAANPNIAIKAGAPAANGWTNYTASCGDVNMNTLGGGAARPVQHSVLLRTLNAGDIVSKRVRLSAPFAVARIGSINCLSSLGLPKNTMTDLFTVDNGDVLITLIGGAGDLASTDVVTVEVFSA